jgi:hypothetical protein
VLIKDEVSKVTNGLHSIVVAEVIKLQSSRKNDTIAVLPFLNLEILFKYNALLFSNF